MALMVFIQDAVYAQELLIQVAKGFNLLVMSLTQRYLGTRVEGGLDAVSLGHFLNSNIFKLLPLLTLGRALLDS